MLLVTVEATYLSPDVLSQARLLTTLHLWKRRSLWSVFAQPSLPGTASRSLPPVTVVLCQSLCYTPTAAFGTTRRVLTRLQRLCWPYVTSAHLLKVHAHLYELNASVSP